MLPRVRRMPMLDAYIPEGALAPEAEQKLLSRCTDLLLEHEGADPTNEAVRSIAWVASTERRSVHATTIASAADESARRARAWTSDGVSARCSLPVNRSSGQAEPTTSTPDASRNATVAACSSGS